MSRKEILEIRRFLEIRSFNTYSFYYFLKHLSRRIRHFLLETLEIDVAGYLWCSRGSSAVLQPLGDFNDGPKGNRLLAFSMHKSFFNRFLSAFPSSYRGDSIVVVVHNFYLKIGQVLLFLTHILKMKYFIQSLESQCCLSSLEGILLESIWCSLPLFLSHFTKI